MACIAWARAHAPQAAVGETGALRSTQKRSTRTCRQAAKAMLLHSLKSATNHREVFGVSEKLPDCVVQTY